MKQRFDSTKLGLLAGFGLPIIILAVTFLFKGYTFGVIPYIKGLVAYGALSKMLSICVYPNLIPFFIFIWTDRLQSARGVLGATIVIAILVFTLQIIY
ncbi:hypothetical protein [Williamwhitmania taraxaci]|uniref:Uncharacterized protein n=1 Tax=Williamwhitmania taraxaci TaxID=1640674 RepID=A0A1G6LJR3_9BACT|nr:hypothetical protein [Williamwhitmania taraxaci]SDC43528.1 hypothetical protein SAMN05216323_103132 [Williamwhitmania taraxaci]